MLRVPVWGVARWRPRRSTSPSCDGAAYRIGKRWLPSTRPGWRRAARRFPPGSTAQSIGLIFSLLSLGWGGLQQFVFADQHGVRVAEGFGPSDVLLRSGF